MGVLPPPKFYTNFINSRLCTNISLVHFEHPKKSFMKNSPAKIVSNSQRVRANAVWLMNAASLAIAIGALNQVTKSYDGNVLSNLIPRAQATAYVWDGGGTDGNLTSGTNWSGDVAGVAGSKSTATNDTQAFGTAGTARMSITMTSGNRVFGSVTFDALSNTYQSGWNFSDAVGSTSPALVMITGDTGGTTPTKSSLTNNYTVGNVTFNTFVANVTTNNTWTGAANSNTIFSKAVYISDSGSARGLTLNGAGNFTFSSGIKNSYVTTSSQTLTTSSALIITNTGTTSITGAMDVRGQVHTNTRGGTVELNSDNSLVGAGLTRVAATDTTYAFRFTQGNVKLGNALALGTQDQVLGRSSGTSSSFELGVYTNAAITVANNFTLGASTGSVSVLNGYTLGGSSANASTFSGTVFLNKEGRFTQVTGGTLTLSGAITQASSTKNLTLDGEGAINITGSMGAGIIPIVGSVATSSNRVVTLSGTNTFASGVTINSGVLALGSSGALNSTAGSENAITWGASTVGGTLRLNGNSAVVKSLTTNATAGTPIIENANAAASVLTIGNSLNLDSAFAGVIKDGTGAGTLGINKAGTGTLTLSGVNTYTGATSINAGKLALTGSLASGSTVTVGSSGTLLGTGTASGAVNISGTVNPGSAGVGTLTTGATDLQSGGTLNIQFFSGSGTVGTNGWDLLSTGALTTSATSGSKFNINLVSITTVGADTAGDASIFDNTTDQTFEIIRATSLATAFDSTLFTFSTTGFTNGLGGGSWSLTSSGTSIYANFAKLVAGSISYYSAGTWGDTASGTGTGGSWNDGDGSWVSTKTAVFATTGGTVNVGAVTAQKGITISANGYTLSGGTIALADAADLNTVTVDTGITTEISSALSGAGAFTKAGAGTLTLSGANNSLSGGMTIGLGTVKLGSATALGSNTSAVSISSGAVLDLNGTAYTNTNALSIAGTGAVINSGSAASYAGNVTLTAASSIVSTGAITLAGTTNLNGYGLTLTTGAGDITLSNNISGTTGSLTISPAGAGNVTISGGINHGGAITITPATGGGNTTLSGNIGSNVTGLTVGSSNLTGFGTTLVLSGTNTYSGTTTLNAGTVRLGSSSAFGSSSVVAKDWNSGVAIDLNGQTIASSIAVYGTGVSSSGIIYNSSATAATLSGNITLNGNSTILASTGDITFGVIDAGTSALSGSIKSATSSNRTLTLGGNTSTVTNIYVKSGVFQTATGVGSISLTVGNSGSDKVKVNLQGTQTLLATGNVKIAGGTLALESSSTLSSSGMALQSGGSANDNSTYLMIGGSTNTWSSLGIGGNLTFDTTEATSPTTITFTNGGNATNGFGQTGSTNKELQVKSGVTLVIGSNSSSFFDLVGDATTATVAKILKLDGAGTYTINSVVRENKLTTTTVGGGINKTGAGILSLNAANTYTGGTTVGNGTLKVGNATALGADASTVAVSAGATLDLNGTTMTGTNALTLSGTATNAGSSAAATYAGSLTLAASTATLTADANNLTFNSASDVTGAFTLTLNGANNGSLTGALKNSTGGLNKSGAGNWTLAGTGATYSGATNITAGTLTLGASNAIGSGAVTINGGTLAIGANSDTVGTVTLTDGTISGTSGVLTSSADLAASAGTISAKIGGNKGLTKTGNGLLTLSGLSTNTGVTTINGGTISVSSIGNGGVAGNLGAATNGSGNIVINGGILKYTGAGESTDRKIKSGTAVTVDASGTGALVFTSDPYSTATKVGSFVTTDTNSVWTLTGTNTGDNTWDARLVNNGTGLTSLVKSGAGTWVISGDISDSTSVPNAFTGGTTISGGKLKATTADISGNIVNSSVFEFTNGSSLNGSYNGVISGTGSLNKSGAGEVILSGTNTYTGVTTISAGTLSVASIGNGGVAGNLGQATNAAANLVLGGGTLKYTESSVSSDRNFTLSTGTSSTIDVNTSGTTLTLSGASTATTGALTKAGAGTLTLTGASLHTGTTTISAGVLNIGSTGSIASSAVTVANAATLKATNSSMPASAIASAITLNNGAIIDLTAGSFKATSLSVGALSTDSATISYTIGTSFALTGALTLTGNLVLDLTGTLSTEGVYDVLTFDSLTANPTGAISLFDRSGGSGTWGNYSVTGNTTATKYTITVSSFTEGGNYSSGNISVPNGGSIGTFSGGTANISADNTVINTFSGGNLALTSNAKVKVKAGSSSGVISGTGALVKEGAGILELTAANTYTAKTEITEGTLKVSSKDANGKIDGLGTHTDLALGSGSNESKLSIAATGAATLDKNIIASSTERDGTGNILENSGTGLLTVTGSLTKDGTVLTLAGGANGMKVTGSIIGASSGSDLVVSSGVVTVSSSNSYNGPTFVNAGTLIADNASATGAGIVNVASGATLQVGTSTNYALTLSTGGFALTNGAIIRVYVGSVDTTGLTANAGAAGFDTNYTHFDLSNNAGVTYSTLTTSGTLDLTGVTAGGITIQVYSTDAVNGTTGFEKSPFYDFKFLQAASVTHSLGGAGNIASLFTINTDNLKYSDGTTVTGAQYAGQNIAGLIKMYAVTSGGNTVLMMSIPEPSTYGLGLGALALAAVAIRRRKQKKSVA